MHSRGRKKWAKRSSTVRFAESPEQAELALPPLSDEDVERLHRPLTRPGSISSTATGDPYANQDGGENEDQDAASPASPESGEADASPKRVDSQVDHPFVQDYPPDYNKPKNAPVWRYYMEESAKSDQEMLRGWNDTINIFLIFTALFSAVVTAFVIDSYPTLQPDNSQAILNVLMTISAQLAAMSPEAGSSQTSTQPISSTVNPAYLWVNGLWLVSLAISLLGAILAMLIKQWLHEYRRGLSSTPIEHTRLRQFRYMGLRKWRVGGIINSLPSVIHVAVFLFFGGLVAFLWDVNVALAWLMSGLLVFSFTGYSILILLPCRTPDCPYKSPLSEAITFLAGQASTKINEFYDTLERYITRTRSPATSPSVYSNPENSMIETQPDAIDTLAFSWLVLNCSKREVQEAALMAFVGWEQPPDAWRNVSTRVTPVVQAIVTRLCTELSHQNGANTELGAQLYKLVAMTKLLEAHKDEPQGLNNIRALCKSLTNQATSDMPVPPSQLASAYLLCYDPLHQDTSALGNAVVSLTRALESSTVPSFGCFLLMERIRDELPHNWGYNLYEKDRVARLIIALSHTLASSKDVPPEYLMKALSFIRELISPWKARAQRGYVRVYYDCDGNRKEFNDADLPHRSTLSSDLLICPDPVLLEILQTLQVLCRTRLEQGLHSPISAVYDPYMILWLLLHCLINNISAFDGQYEGLLRFLCLYLPSGCPSRGGDSAKVLNLESGTIFGPGPQHVVPVVANTILILAGRIDPANWNEVHKPMTLQDLLNSLLCASAPGSVVRSTMKVVAYILTPDLRIPDMSSWDEQRGGQIRDNFYSLVALLRHRWHQPVCIVVTRLARRFVAYEEEHGYSLGLLDHIVLSGWMNMMAETGLHNSLGLAQQDNDSDDYAGYWFKCDVTRYLGMVTTIVETLYRYKKRAVVSSRILETLTQLGTTGAQLPRDLKALLDDHTTSSPQATEAELVDDSSRLQDPSSSSSRPTPRVMSGERNNVVGTDELHAESLRVENGGILSDSSGVSIGLGDQTQLNGSRPTRQTESIDTRSREFGGNWVEGDQEAYEMRGFSKT